MILYRKNVWGTVWSLHCCKICWLQRFRLRWKDFLSADFSNKYSLLWWRDLSCTSRHLKMKELHCRCRWYLQHSCFQSDIPWAAHHPALLKCCRFPLLHAAGDRGGWVVLSSVFHCGQCQMRLDRLWWSGFTGLCLEHLLCCSEASVRRVCETVGHWRCCPEKFMESRFDGVLFRKNVDIGRRWHCALVPFELGEWAPKCPVLLQGQGKPEECARAGEALCVPGKEKFPVCPFSSCTAPWVHQGRMLLPAQGSVFKLHIGLDWVVEQPEINYSKWCGNSRDISKPSKSRALPPVKRQCMARCPAW